MNRKIPIVRVIGDSHSQYLDLANADAVDRMRLPRPLPFTMKPTVVRGASLTGLRAYNSTLQLREAIETAATSANYLCINLGQVDLELGFYYRQVIKGETVTVDGYLDFLTDIYKNFLTQLVLGDCRLAVKGVNLSVLSSRTFSAFYVGRILTENGQGDDRKAREKLYEILLPETAQNQMHLDFNARVKDVCDDLGYPYFDLNDYLIKRDAAGKPVSPAIIDPRFQPMKRDHHLTPSIAVFRQHYLELGQALGLIDAEWISALP